MPAKLNQETFINRVKNNHSTQNYDYSLSVYSGSNNKVKVICPEHGVFEKRACDLMSSDGCPKCGMSKRVVKSTFPTEIFIKEARKIHGDKYDYSKVEYVNCETKVSIICPKHGEFSKSPIKHISGQGCPKCSQELQAKKQTKNKEDLINELTNVYGDVYDFSKVEYKKMKTPICVICKKHGEFYARPDHLKNGHGCPICKESSLERVVRMCLKNANINVIPQYHNTTLLQKQSLDFYLPDYNIAIECQGEQHFKHCFYELYNKSNNMTPEESLIYMQKLDVRKKRICTNNNIRLIYYLDKQFIEYMSEDDIYFTNTDDLIEYIKKYKDNTCINEK